MANQGLINKQIKILIIALILAGAGAFAVYYVILNQQGSDIGQNTQLCSTSYNFDYGSGYPVDNSTVRPAFVLAPGTQIGKICVTYFYAIGENVTASCLRTSI